MVAPVHGCPSAPGHRSDRSGHLLPWSSHRHQSAPGSHGGASAPHPGGGGGGAGGAGGGRGGGGHPRTLLLQQPLHQAGHLSRLPGRKWEVYPLHKPDHVWVQKLFLLLFLQTFLLARARWTSWRSWSGAPRSTRLMWTSSRCTINFKLI